MSAAPSHPPRLAERLLAFVLPETLREPFLADLAEIYAGRPTADRGWYWRQAARVCWPPTLVALHRQASHAARAPRHGLHAEIAALPNARTAVESVSYDLRFALRTLRRRPWWAAMIVVTLALGIGANSTMFGVLTRLLLQAPPHIAQPDDVFLIHLHTRGTPWFQSAHPYVYRTLFSEAVPDFAGVAVATPTSVGRRQFFPTGHGPDASRVAGALVTGNYFSVLGVRPALGRFFTDAETADANGAKLAVLGFGYWRQRFDGRRDVLGQTIDIGAGRFTIVGVAPSGFTGTELRDVDVWLPVATSPDLRFAKDSGWATTESSQWLLLVARLRPGATRARAEAEATAAYRNWERARSTETSAAALARVDSQEVVLGSIVPARSLWGYAGSGSSSDARVSELMAGIAFIVLLIACANVANLLLVRALGRRREVAVRLALGVSRRRLVRQFVLEGLLLSSAGTLGAVGITIAGTHAVRRWLIGDGAWSAGTMTSPVFLMTVAAGLVAGVATSLVPALQVSRPDLSASLKAGVRDGAVQRSRLRGALLAGQAALAILLVSGAALFVRSVRNAARLDLGIDATHLLVARIGRPATAAPNDDARGRLAAITARVRGLPGVEATSVSVGLPFSLSWTARIRVPGRALPKLRQPPVQYVVTPAYFDAMGIRTRLGRPFAASDDAGAPRVALVNETMARMYWPGRSPIGACVTVGADSMPCVTVVGVVANTRRQDLVEGPVPQIYRPMDQVPAAEMANTVSFFGYSFVVRTAGDPAALADPVRRAIQSAAPELPYVEVHAMTDLLAPQTRAWSLGARVFSAFGALALALSGIGLFSVVLFTINQRVHEMGVRTALGAQRVDLLRLTVSRGMGPAVAGIVLGVFLTWASARLLDGLLFQVSPRDPATLAMAAAAMLATALAASLAPAWSASRVDPTAALRAE